MKTRGILIGAGMLVACMTFAAPPPASLKMIPKYINYQGRLVAPDGASYSNTTHGIELRLYEQASGSSPLWGASYSVQTVDGYFSVMIGSAAGVPLGDAPSGELWEVMWKADGSSPDSFFMGLTLLTDKDGAALGAPVEASPRQQFATSPFAYRAHQSQYANAAVDVFDAPEGIITPSLTSTSSITVASSGPQIALEAPTVVVGQNGRVDLSVNTASNLTVRAQPMFKYWRGSASFSAGTPYALVAIGMYTSDYDITLTEWRCTGDTPEGVLVTYVWEYVGGEFGTWRWVPYARADFFGNSAAAAGTLHVRALGIRKGLMDGFTNP